MGFWSNLLAEFQIALAKKDTDSFFYNSVENRNQQRTTYQELGSLQRYHDYLIKMASSERAGVEPNVMSSMTFGVTQNGQL